MFVQVLRKSSHPFLIKGVENRGVGPRAVDPISSESLVNICYEVRALGRGLGGADLVSMPLRGLKIEHDGYRRSRGYIAKTFR